LTELGDALSEAQMRNGTKSRGMVRQRLEVRVGVVGQHGLRVPRLRLGGGSVALRAMTSSCTVLC